MANVRAEISPRHFFQAFPTLQFNKCAIAKFVRAAKKYRSQIDGAFRKLSLLRDSASYLNPFEKRRIVFGSSRCVQALQSLDFVSMRESVKKSLRDVIHMSLKILARRDGKPQQFNAALHLARRQRRALAHPYAGDRIDKCGERLRPVLLPGKGRAKNS